LKGQAGKSGLFVAIGQAGHLFAEIRLAYGGLGERSPSMPAVIGDLLTTMPAS
jgi:hypothetical protein